MSDTYLQKTYIIFFLFIHLSFYPVNSWAEPVKLLKEFNYGIRAELKETAKLNGSLYFLVNHSGYFLDLWKSDGTETGTSLVKHMEDPGDFVYYWSPITLGNNIYFWASDYYHGLELWKSDGTTAGTAMVKDICPGRCSSTSYKTENEIILLGNTIYFFAYDENYHTMLWKSDGTENGTIMVRDFNRLYYHYPDHLMSVNNNIYFVLSGNQLWKSDGTELGTVLVKSFFELNNDGTENTAVSDISNITDINGILFISTNSALWKSDGTEAGTVIVKDNIRHITYRGGAASMNNNFYFPAFSDDPQGTELWVSNGTEDGTTILRDIAVTDPAYNPYQEDSYPRSLISNHAGILFFTADDYFHGRELWKSDGTYSGTTMVKDITPGDEDTSFNNTYHPNIIIMHEMLYFAANRA